MSQKGKPLTREYREAIVSVKTFFDAKKRKLGLTATSYDLTADALGVGPATVRRVIATHNKSPTHLARPPAARGRPAHTISARHEEEVRTFVREANRAGRFVTIDSIRELMRGKEGNGEDYPHSTLARTLDRWGFTFGKGTRTQHLKEKDHVIAARRRYLREKLANRNGSGTIRPEVYLDESYVNKNHSNDFTWYYGEDGPWLQKPTGKGDRLIILNAITSEGWVPAAKLVFKAGRKTGDYHGQMNVDMFTKWFTEMLLPNIPSESLIILDNASYHNALSTCSPPTPACSKARIKAWLAANNCPCRDDMVKAEIVDLLKSKAPPTPIYVLDELARQKGHEVLRTPPYHPELQPIEVCWGITKNHIGKNNSDFTMVNLHAQLEAGFAKVTAETCKGLIKKIRATEDKFWKEDYELDVLENG